MPIDINGYLKSITDEFMAQRNRVRHFIGLDHLPSDGAWKEAVLRAMISRTLPSRYAVASGFVITEETASSQIDVLIYDTSIPVLYKGGDLVFVQPSACAAVIEVKSSLNATAFRNAARKLSDVCELIHRHERDNRLFAGIFAYEESGGSSRILLQHIADAAEGERNRIVNHASIGADTFIKYWSHNPDNGRDDYDYWHHYTLRRMAPGYFLHNLMSFLADEELVRGNNIWFPSEGKETRRNARQPLR
ncbi:hypothetical protein X986_1156 [Burkholderia pseudomallei]|uniref:DUF6602 domain-containing protein n=1 Tax=Burkholderia pseudomallei TaxID=28450 RepID=UPI0005384AAD|nr:DUF6602 domain-containing protein [Burkholderia pseudomallei]KGX77344.1 hypothetical protein Y033_3394 [Burkholderia pseudomallei MSHR435]AJX23438.1 hypothetical protein BG17_2044 [Burkholderia pseudomallei MSHR491]AJX76961.1 hypothetical protein BG16_2465 [Burkholderia pseudomallei MSHR2543]KGV77325.1 hypothetical protein X944_5509 [Burkholderia pseudomallei MSHR3964]KGV86460.1 hypothetical protein X879_698 [Burkholderia pseudomallei MSHR3951]